MKKKRNKKAAVKKPRAAKSPTKAQNQLREADPATARAAIQTRFQRSGAERLWRHAAAEGRRRQARRDAK